MNSAAYNKPDLIRDCISDLLPLLYDQTNINTDLIHTVEMGPFKHQVDDGLEIRKVKIKINKLIKVINFYFQ